MRAMAVDYGDAHTGVAVSDPTGTLAGEAWTVDEWNAGRLAETLARAAAERGADVIVLGYPLNMDGTAGPRAEKSMALGEELRRLTGLRVVMWDERRTSVDAHRILSENGKRAKKHKKTVDAVAAALILEAYLGGAQKG